MKKQLMVLGFVLISMLTKAQFLNDGSYIFENAKIKLTIDVAGDGHTIESATIKDIGTGKEEKGTGEFMSANETGWYQFQTEICNYEFDLKNATSISL